MGRECNCEEADLLTMYRGEIVPRQTQSVAADDHIECDAVQSASYNHREIVLIFMIRAAKILTFIGTHFIEIPCVTVEKQLQARIILSLGYCLKPIKI